MQAWIKKMRKNGSAWMAVLFVLLAFLVNQFNSNIGYALSMAGLLAIVAQFIVAVVVGVTISLVDTLPNNKLQIWKAILMSFIVLVVVSIVSPLSNMLINWFGL